MISEQKFVTDYSVSVAICTRNRGVGIVATIQSILASPDKYRELIVVDQSSTNVTEDAVSQFQTERRFKYVRSNTAGLGIARNIALLIAESDIVAFTDDDCIVTSQWLNGHLKAYRQFPKVILTFGAVDVAAHDPKKGYIPGYKLDHDRHIRTFSQKRFGRGIGANMSVRRAEILSLGGFDELFGAGGLLRSGEDVDMTIRTVMGAYEIYETTESVIVHEGYRDWSAGSKHSTNDMIGIGAACAKPLKFGRLDGFWVVAEELGTHTVKPFFRALIRRKGPLGIRRILGFFKGFAEGWRYTVDPTTFHYKGSAEKL
jgi:glycosyltransferase involved in cell wall biosynthesis